MATLSNRPKNTIKSEIKDIPEKEPKKQVAHRKKTDDFRKIIGLFLILTSAFLLLSFISYIFTWKADQSQIGLSYSGETKNVMKQLGAISGNWFIYRGFGLSSFLFIFIFFVSGFKLFFNISLVPIWKSMTTTLFMVFWISVTLGLIFQDSYPISGGNFGKYATISLNNMLGLPGTVLFLIFIMLVYMILVYSIPVPEMLTSFFSRSKKSEEPILTLTNKLNKTIEENNDEDELKQSDTLEDDEIDYEIKFEINTREFPERQSLPQKKDFKEISLEIEKPTEKEEEIVSFTGNEKKPSAFFNPVNSLPDYKYPSVDLLKDYPEKEVEISQAELEERKNLIIQTLRNYSIEIDKIKATVGPTVTLYEIVPAAGVRISKIRNLEDDIALSLAALGIRIIAPIPGRGTIGIEVPNKKPEIVSIKSVLSSPKFQNFDKELPIALGRTINNEVYVADLAKMPHLLIAGATGQGKSVGINVILASLLYKKHPSQIKFVMIDPKKVELSIYQRIEKHFLARLPNVDSSIITDVTEVVQTLNSLLAELDQRMKLFNLIPVRHITEYNAKFLAGQLEVEKGHRFLPYIVLIIDELADLMLTAGKEVEMPIARLAQIARAFGIHLIVSTQRPSVNIITGTIKANFPARIAFKVVATVDSRTILDHKGAEQLIGNGDMLLSMGSDVIRLQCPLIETSEVEDLINFIATQPSSPEMMMLPEVKTEGIEKFGELDDLDPLFEEAARIIVQHQQGSTSLIQRRLKLGYNRAGRIMDQLEQAGIVGQSEGSKARTVLIQDDYALEQFLKAFNGD